MNIVIGMTGATGAIYGVRMLEYLSGVPDVKTHLVISRWAQETIAHETRMAVADVIALADYYYSQDNLAAAISSGSFAHDGMIVVPCSMKTLGTIANGIGDGLISRAADVTMKENRKLILAVRETPFSPIHLENMLKLSKLGVTIMPPVPNFYSKPNTLDDIVNSFAGRALAHLGIPNDLYKPWGGEIL
jgi:4-hydroxy-3-polyprenylbenzoate decarboxylase